MKMIAYWMVPGWMILIQVMATCAIITSLAAQTVSVSLVLRHPVQVVLRFERRIITALMILNIMTALFVSVSVTVFPIYCWSRDYLLYPNYNYLSWSYAAAGFSLLSSLASVGFLSQELPEVKHREEKNLAILYKVYPNLNPSNNTLEGSSVTGSFI